MLSLLAVALLSACISRTDDSKSPVVQSSLRSPSSNQTRISVTKSIPTLLRIEHLQNADRIEWEICDLGLKNCNYKGQLCETAQARFFQPGRHLLKYRPCSSSCGSQQTLSFWITKKSEHKDEYENNFSALDSQIDKAQATAKEFLQKGSSASDLNSYAEKFVNLDRCRLGAFIRSSAYDTLKEKVQATATQQKTLANGLILLSIAKIGIPKFTTHKLKPAEKTPMQIQDERRRYLIKTRKSKKIDHDFEFPVGGEVALSILIAGVLETLISLGLSSNPTDFIEEMANIEAEIDRSRSAMKKILSIYQIET